MANYRRRKVKIKQPFVIKFLPTVVYRIKVSLFSIIAFTANFSVKWAVIMAMVGWWAQTIWGICLTIWNIFKQGLEVTSTSLVAYSRGLRLWNLLYCKIACWILSKVVQPVSCNCTYSTWKYYLIYKKFTYFNFGIALGNSRVSPLFYRFDYFFDLQPI